MSPVLTVCFRLSLLLCIPLIISLSLPFSAPLLSSPSSTPTTTNSANNYPPLSVRSPSTNSLSPGIIYAQAKSKSKTSKGGSDGSSSSPSLVDSMIHHITVLTPQNYNTKIRQFRDRQISVVLFGSALNEECKALVEGEFDKLAKEMKGLAVVGAVDCDMYTALCGDNGVQSTSYPTVMIYPVNPFPPYEFKESVTVGHLKKHLSRLIPSNVEVVDAQNFDMFLAGVVSQPKVVLFSEKKNPPVLFKALSNAFKDNLRFGLVNTSVPQNMELSKRWRISNMPRLVVIKTGQAPKSANDLHPHEIYKGKLTFDALHDWLNVFSETFGLGGGFTDKGSIDKASQEGKPWLIQRVPEVTLDSHVDVCFHKGKQSKGLCVIYLKDGGPLTIEETSMLENLSELFTSHLEDRGAAFRWMWMDVAVEEGFRELFEVDSTSLPSVVVFNPHKRLRFTSLPPDTPATLETMKDLLNKIAGGDARFKNVKGQTLPAFTDRKGGDAATPAPGGKDEL
eukprot:GHVQ01008302.1.p1 GENE.GHVQ01008302.1~~GHVQ01008302.1.p1  ORF type:complete len:507 (-),score=94.49 GHVQ01008302.1:1227-2747(-)